jgi:glycosyltransferase involved in cell wall biosynthesis
MSGLKSMAAKAMEILAPGSLGEEYKYIELEKIIPDCDVNVATFCFTAFAVHRSGKGKPFYHMQHFEPLFFDDPRLKRKAEETYYLPLTKVANSSWLKRTVEERIGVSPELVLHGMDHETFRPREVPKKEDKKTIVAFAKQVAWKGVPDLLEAMHIVMSKRSDVELILYGASPITHVREGVPYRFLRGISDEDLARLYSSADVVVCPSWYESFPLPPLEAMACGAPVVTTQYGTEDYAIDEETALVVPPREPAKMADAILRVLSDEGLSERLRKAGPKKAKAFTWDRTADGFDKIFRGETR